MERRSAVIAPTRREVLRYGAVGLGWLVGGSTLMGCGDDDNFPEARARQSNFANLGPLGEPDANGVRVPAGFQARILARTGSKPLAEKDYVWHIAPDGGATFATDDGGWIYVSNSEWFLPPTLGGVGALRFDAGGNVVDAYSILSGSTQNCAGGPTPWGTWLSGEENIRGVVWECDPFGREPAVQRPALGVYQHEAVAVDPLRHQLYLTEDTPDGRFYRYSPARLTAAGNPDLTDGVLEVAQVAGGPEGAVSWHAVPDPSAATVPTRLQVAESTAFDGGEGIWYHQGLIYFTTKGDNRVWAYDTRADTIAIYYDDDRFEQPILRGVDNVVVSEAGDVLVAEDGDNMQIVAITPSGAIVPVVQIDGHSRSEITGPAFDPSGTRLYFSSQRGSTGRAFDGVTYELSGPFFVSS